MGTKLQHGLETVICNFFIIWPNPNWNITVKNLDFSLPPQKLKFENHLPFEWSYRDVINDEMKDDDALMHLKNKMF